jgi:hypothetical protein
MAEIKNNNLTVTLSKDEFRAVVALLGKNKPSFCNAISVDYATINALYFNLKNHLENETPWEPIPNNFVWDWFLENKG